MRALIRFLLPFALAAALLAVSPGCFTRDQFLIYVTTDAPVPSWGDRVLLEILNDDGTLACDDCRRDFNVKKEDFPVKFGMAPPVHSPSLHVRARFYHASQTGPDGIPRGTELIDEVQKLPDYATVKTHVFTGFLLLPSLCFGVPARLTPGAFKSCTIVQDTGAVQLAEEELPELAEDAGLTGLLPGQISLAAAPCATPPDGTICFHGTPFLLGELQTLGVDSDYPAQPIRALVPIYSWNVDIDEMTVGTARKLIDANKVTSRGIAARGSGPGTEGCTYLSAKNASNDALPLNCVDYLGAYEICAALGKELPREDVWESFAQNGDDESPYPWGAEPPTCERSILSSSPACARQGPVVGGAVGDVTPAGIRNLGGNLSEWVYGPFKSYSDACWQVDGSIFYDGECSDDVASVTNDGYRVHRGGSYKRRATSAATFARFVASGTTQAPDIGFRCVQRVVE